jgi:hypothetical protein
MKEYGNFYPELIENPEKYIIPQPYFHLILTTLKQKNKSIFLTSNFHLELTELILTTTLGKDYL